MMTIPTLLNELESYIPHYHVSRPEVSKGSVGWHIDHTLLTLNLIIDVMKKSNPEGYRWSFNIMRILVCNTGKIPRGKAKAPDVVQPKSLITPESLQLQLAAAKEGLMTLENLHPNQYFTHPFFGDLNRKPTVRFLKIHTYHHVKIIRDIISKMQTAQ